MRLGALAAAGSIMMFVLLSQPGGSFPQLSNARAQEDSVPDGVDILLPRGGIPAIFDPGFVSADEAKIPDDAWVMGVVIDGEAHAYSLNLLNHHEVVNDHFGDLPVAAVW